MTGISGRRSAGKKENLVKQGPMKISRQEKFHAVGLDLQSYIENNEDESEDEKVGEDKKLPGVAQ